jgi:hypothetical protein
MFFFDEVRNWVVISNEPQICGCDPNQKNKANHKKCLRRRIQKDHDEASKFSGGSALMGFFWWKERTGDGVGSEE